MQSNGAGLDCQMELSPGRYTIYLSREKEVFTPESKVLSFGANRKF